MVTPTQENLKNRLAALHSSGLNLLQELSPEGLFERIAALACECTSARYGVLGIMNEKGDILHFSTAGFSENQLENLLFSARSDPHISKKILAGETVRVADFQVSRLKPGKQIVDYKNKSFLGVPIQLGSTRIGYIYLAEKFDSLEFSGDDQLVIEMLASYAGSAIDNARRYQVLQEKILDLDQKNKNLTLIHKLAANLVFAEIDPILNNALKQVLETLNLEAGEIFVKPENEKVLKRVLHRGGPSDRLWTLSQFKIGEGMVGLTAQTGQARFLNLSLEDDTSLDEEMLDSGIYQVACFPIISHNGVVGVMSIGTGFPRPLNELEIQFISLVCTWVGTSIENVRINLQSKRKAVLEERERIGMDLHDGIIQSIYAVGLTLDHARLLLVENPDVAQERIQHAIDGLNSAIRDIRTYILDLRPRQLNNEDLMQGLQRLVTEFRTNTLVETHLDGPLNGVTSKLLPVNALALFHICQESLANAAKHARARRVDVNVWLTNERAILEVRDDGRGFDAEKTAGTLGHGLSNIYTRARNVGGDVEITSESGFGTTVLCWVPLKNDE